MNKKSLYRGLLCALREQSNWDTFIGEGPQFQRAFGLALNNLQGNPLCPEFLQKIQPDPVFGVYEEAQEMLLEGETDLLVSLEDTTPRRARFTISKSEANSILDATPDANLLRTLAKILVNSLEPKNNLPQYSRVFFGGEKQ